MARLEIEMEKAFSDRLQNWLGGDDEKTIAGLGSIFEEKSFAITFLVLMFPASLPLPTGGVTHLFEGVTMLLSLELIAQRKTIWLPKRWRNKPLGKIMQFKILPKLVKMTHKAEKLSHPRMSQFLRTRIARTSFGISTLFFTLIALLAVPFSGLDTLPSMGVIGMSLGIILDDILIAGIGLILGTTGTVLSIGFGATIAKWVGDIF